MLARLDDPEVSDEVLLMYAHHFDQGIRASAAGAINNHGRYHLVRAAAEIQGSPRPPRRDRPASPA